MNVIVQYSWSLKLNFLNKFKHYAQTEEMLNKQKTALAHSLGKQQNKNFKFLISF